MDAQIPKHTRADGDSLSLVIPAYNEAAVIETAIREAVDALRSLEIDFEILVVDDGSTDATAALAESEAVQFPEVQVIRQPRNLGYGAALRTGFDRATKSLIGFTDADCQFNLHELNRLVMLTQDYDIACGYRIERKDSAIRCFCSQSYNVLVRMLLGTRIRDCDCALKVFRREALRKLCIETDGFFVNAELLTRARQQGLTIVEVGVSHRPRFAGETTVSLAHTIPVFATLLRFWWSRVMFPGTSRSSGGEWSPRVRWIMGATLATLAGLLLFINLGYPLIEPDETRYAQIALEMNDSGDFLVPRLQGELYLDKPPLLYWLTCASYRVFGPGPWAARLPSALAGWLLVLATYVLGIRLIGCRSAWLGSLFLLLCTGFIFSSRFLIMDEVLTLFTTLSLLCMGCALQAKSRVGGWWLLAGIACGFGVLTKGPVAAVLCLPPALIMAFLSDANRRPGWPNFIAFLIPATLITAPWFLAISIEQPEFLGYFFLKHNLIRFTQAFDHQEPWWFYMPILLAGMFPASLLLPALLHYLFGRSQRLSDMRSGSLGFLCLSSAWILFFFSLSKCKLPTYILPAFPVLSLVLGKMFVDTFRVPNIASSFSFYVRKAAFTAMVVTLLGAMVAGIADVLLNGLSPFQVVSLLTFVVLPLIGLVWIWGQTGEAWATSPAIVGTIFCIVSLYAFTHVVPEIATWRSNIHNAACLQAELGENTPVAFIGKHSYSALLSIKHGDIEEFEKNELDDFEAFVDAHKFAIVVIHPSFAAKVNELAGDRLVLQPQASSNRRNVFTAKSLVPTVATSEEDHVIR